MEAQTLIVPNVTTGVSFLFNKFNAPLIHGGQIYVPNYNGGVDVYKLTPH
jgi:hypothetical protein